MGFGVGFYRGRPILAGSRGGLIVEPIVYICLRVNHPSRGFGEVAQGSESGWGLWKSFEKVEKWGLYLCEWCVIIEV